MTGHISKEYHQVKVSIRLCAIFLDIDIDTACIMLFWPHSNDNDDDILQTQKMMTESEIPRLKIISAISGKNVPEIIFS